MDDTAAITENDAERTDMPLLPAAQLRQPGGALGPRAQRTIGRIIDGARDVFMVAGYAGTTIDEIANLADVSRASFYTYFPDKRAVLLAAGADTASEGVEVIKELDGHAGTIEELRAWVTKYFTYLDVHGSFAFAWTQAAHYDDEIRTAGMKRHLSMCRLLGRELLDGGGASEHSPVIVGLTSTALMERSWNYCQVYKDTISRTEMIASVAHTIWGSLHRVP